MSSRDELREAIGRAIYEQKATRYGLYHAWEEAPEGDVYNKAACYRDADAVLAVLDQQGWPELEGFRAECDKVGVPYDAAGLVRHHRGNAEMTAATWKAAHDLAVEQRDAALREAARYEPLKVAYDALYEYHRSIVCRHAESVVTKRFDAYRAAADDLRRVTTDEGGQ